MSVDGYPGLAAWHERGGGFGGVLTHIADQMLLRFPGLDLCG
jgi:hypothetical protein